MCGCGQHSLHNRSQPGHAEAPEASASPEPVTKPCPRCETPNQEDFDFCTRCGAELQTVCPECRRTVQTDWTNCAYCGADLITERLAVVPD